MTLASLALPEPMCGLLWKQSPSPFLFGSLQQRRMDCCDGKLIWRSPTGDKHPQPEKGCIDFEHQSCILETVPDNGTRFILRPEGGQWKAGANFSGASRGRIFVFDASGSEFSREQWIEAIEENMLYGKQKADMAKSLKPSESLEGTMSNPGESVTQSFQHNIEFVSDEDGSVIASVDTSKYHAKHVICIAGSPAAGKGTQCEFIVEHYGLIHITVGEILHNHVMRQTPIGTWAKTFMDAGKMVPSEIVCNILKERLEAPDVQNRGCLLDNFPITVEDAKALVRSVRSVDLFIDLQVPDEVAITRATGRCLDPQTGAIYHRTELPPPSKVQGRVTQPLDDSENIIRKRLKIWKQRRSGVTEIFSDLGKLRSIDASKPAAEVFNSIRACLDELSWDFFRGPYSGNLAFEDRFTETDAKRAGFFSSDDPPCPGDQVVSFRKEGSWQKRGQVVKVEEDVVSSGEGGLLQGEEGAWITIAEDENHSFSSWSVFLAPINDFLYSSVCTTSEFQASQFCQMCADRGHLTEVSPVPKQEACNSLHDWLQHLRDSDGEPLGLFDNVIEELVSMLNDKEDGSLYLYTTHQKIADRIEMEPGKDFSLFFRALNNTLNRDLEEDLQRALPFFQHMTYSLLYRVDGSKRYHSGCRVWKGDTQVPVPLNMQKLKTAVLLGSAVRFRQFFSTTSDEQVARRYMQREARHGYLWTVDIPDGFWGARDISDISWKGREEETLFPPYSAFHVKSVDDEGCHLLAVDFGVELSIKAERHGLRGTPIELCGP